jgi:hypothetical protein
MKSILIIILFITLFGTGFYSTESSCTKTSTNTEFISSDSLLGVYEGKIPCPDCERTKVRLTLYTNKNNSPTEYKLERIYVGKGDDRTTTTGSWTISQGISSNPSATVYQLDSNSPSEFRSYYAVDNNLLLFLDENKNLKVGDAAHSFTLSRTK